MSVLKFNFITVLIFFFYSQLTFGQSNADSLDFYIEKKEILKALDLINSYDKNAILQKDKKLYVDLKIKESNLYASLNDYEKAIDLLYKSLSKIKSYSNQNLQTKIYLELGTKYSSIKDTVNSFKNYHIAEKIAYKNKDNSNLRHIYHNLFRLHVLKDNDSALFYIQKKYAVDKLENEPSGTAITYNNYFAYHSVRNEYDIAKKYLDSAYQLSIKYDIKHAIRTSLSNYGYYYSVEKGDFKKALNYYEQLENNHQKELTQSELCNLYLNFGYVYENLGDYANANLYHVFYIQLSQKMYNQEIKDAVKDIETKYKIEKIETDYLEEKKQIIENDDRNKKLIIFFVFLLLLLIFMFYFFYQNIKLKERNRKKEIDSIIQRKIINANIDGQEKERKLIAGILHDQISALLSSAGLHLKAFEYKSEITNDELNKTKSIIKEAHDQVRDLSHQLIPPVLVKLGLKEALQDLCDKNSNSIIKFTFSDNSSDFKLNKNFEIKIYYVVSELINNIIKHSKADHAELHFEINQNVLMIFIQDNGIGISKKDKQKGGLGLLQTTTRINGLGGNIKIEKLNGLKISITIPLDSSSVS